MTASRGIRRPAGPPTLEWLEAQTIRMPCLVPGLGDCWVWQKSKLHDGYARTCVGGRDVVAHRVAYEVKHGPVHCWLTVDHLCRRRDCINPDHCEPMSQTENTLRGEAPNAVIHRTGKCQRGHDALPGERCRICRAERQREWYERKLAAQAETKAAVLAKRSA